MTHCLNIHRATGTGQKTSQTGVLTLVGVRGNGVTAEQPWGGREHCFWKAGWAGLPIAWPLGEGGAENTIRLFAEKG